MELPCSYAVSQSAISPQGNSGKQSSNDWEKEILVGSILYAVLWSFSFQCTQALAEVFVIRDSEHLTSATPLGCRRADEDQAKACPGIGMVMGRGRVRVKHLPACWHTRLSLLYPYSPNVTGKNPYPQGKRVPDGY
jgi:hypothetical protein